MVNYPNKKTGNKQINFSNRGATLEEDINETNEYYLAHNKAVIHKKPTPIQIVKVDYPRRSAAKITEAYFKIASTTDYNGVYQGKYIDFEAKETENLTVFPLSNLHLHQIEHLKNVYQHGGIAFILVRFKKLARTFVLFYEQLEKIINTKEMTRHIKIEQFATQGFEIETKLHPRVDYLKAIDLYIQIN